VKWKHQRSLEVVVCGWAPTGTTVKALLLGVPDDGGRRYVGAIGTGFSDAERRTLAGLLGRLTAPASPLTSGPAPARGFRHGSSAIDSPASRPTTLAHLESASFLAADRTLDKSHRCRSAALSTYLIKTRTGPAVKARG
jgi:hypothetical protein